MDVLIKVLYPYYAVSDGRFIFVAREKSGKEKVVRLKPNRIKGMFILRSTAIPYRTVPNHLVILYTSDKAYYQRFDWGIGLLKNRKESIDELNSEGDYTNFTFKEAPYQPCDKQRKGWKLKCGGCWNAGCCLHKATYGYNYCDPVDTEEFFG